MIVFIIYIFFLQGGFKKYIFWDYIDIKTYIVLTFDCMLTSYKVLFIIIDPKYGENMFILSSNTYCCWTGAPVSILFLHRYSYRKSPCVWNSLRPLSLPCNDFSGLHLATYKIIQDSIINYIVTFLWKLSLSLYFWRFTTSV